jgi:thiol-disulfide isomerase/thioredoxin
MHRALSILAALFLSASLNAALSIGQKSPHFELKDLNGKTWTPEKDSKHRLLLVDFWASWCVPCLKEIPTLKQLQAAHAKDGAFTVLGISMEKGGRPQTEAAAVKYSVDYPVLIGSADVAKAFGVQGFPSAVLIRDGKVLKVLVGERKLKDFEEDLAPFWAKKKD